MARALTSMSGERNSRGEDGVVDEGPPLLNAVVGWATPNLLRLNTCWFECGGDCIPVWVGPVGPVGIAES
jgi:hypothetical protein